MTKTWMMFQESYENLPESLVKNVKYMIQEEDSYRYKVMGTDIRKPVDNVVIGEVEYPYSHDL